MKTNKSIIKFKDNLAAFYRMLQNTLSILMVQPNILEVDYIYNFMQHIQNSNQDGLEFHINKNAQFYQQNIIQEKTLNCTLPKLITLEDIKLVSSTQVSGDGHNNPVLIICSGCQNKVQTVLTRHSGKSTILVGFILFLCSFGFICVACIPCCLDDCKDIRHNCPQCQKTLGKTTFNILK
ncbi:unnamed protein product [Paramecium primaurelia]|uniref:LITAF domain-containing protein n=1 Tax=Paramecium primaurelia TaxID=5886 RepID=A0A8S1NQ61_PARPR|nr:unnamed protein product [Paramecium primaurelia]